MAEAQEQISIKTLFLEGQKLYEKIEDSSLSSSDPAYQDDVKKAIGNFLRVSALVTKLSVFSKNEILEDINTADLRFLLTGYYLGELYLKLMGDDRQKIVTSAQNQFQGFLSACTTHLIMTLEERASQERLETPPKDPAELRREKLERHKKTKELKAKISQLSAQLGGLEKGIEGKGKERQAAAEDGADDEEVDRELVLSLLHLSIENSFDQLGMIKRELEILQHVQQLKEAGREAELRGPPPQPPRTPGSSGFKPIVIQNTREVLRQQVFQPGWRQPTMTLDQYLELERQGGNILEGGGPEQEARMEREKEEKLLRDSEKDADEETYKQREWDEFKDYNPRGQGNRYNRS